MKRVRSAVESLSINARETGCLQKPALERIQEFVARKSDKLPDIVVSLTRERNRFRQAIRAGLKSELL